MPGRTAPYGAFNFTVSIGGAETFGGFSDVNGLTSDIKAAEYRSGVDPENHVRKIPGMHAVGDVTLKRGIINSTDLWTWIDDVRRTGPSGKRTVVITMRDENAQPVEVFTLQACFPLKWTGPALAAKAGTDVAMEELVLSAEGLEISAP